MSQQTLVVPSPAELEIVRTKAAAARTARASYKRAIKAGTVNIDDVLAAIDAADPIVSNIRVGAFLRAFKSIGPIKATEIAERIGVDLKRRIGGLGVRQKENLFDILRAKGF